MCVCVCGVRRPHIWTVVQNSRVAVQYLDAAFQNENEKETRAQLDLMALILSSLRRAAGCSAPGRVSGCILGLRDGRVSRMGEARVGEKMCTWRI